MTEDRRQRIVVIAGPTASGKTRLSVELALALGGEIVSADSMQVYRGMDIGTAKPTIDEKRGVPHHLLDVVDPDEEFDAAMYRARVLPLVAEIEERGNRCLVVGGTGLYLRSLLQGLFPCPSKDQTFRESLNRELEIHGSAALHERLEGLDPDSARRIQPNHRVRILRALEVMLLTNRKRSHLLKEHAFGEKPFKYLKMGLHVERKELYRRIDERSFKMLESGLVEETERLLKQGYSPELKPMQSIGYRHMVRYLGGEWSLAEAIGNLQRDTRRYAKRQLTWFRKDPEVTWIASEDFDSFLRKIEAFYLEAA